MSDEEAPKTDKVISMADFQKSAEQAGEETPPLLTDKEVIDTILKLSKDEDFKRIVVIGEREDGRLAFFSSCEGGRDIIYYCTAFINLVMNNSLTDVMDGGTNNE